MSSRIENYLGFPTGISGEELADRAFHQAQRFGADIVVAREVSALAGVTGDRRLTLENGETVLARAVVLAPGVTYRRLEADGCDALLNRGVYYGAAQSEAGSVTGRRVHVVGGGNSAGQAALYFAEYAESVTIVIRGGTLAETMSQYLIDRIGHTDNVAVLAHTEVTAVSGDGRADAVTLRTAGGETRTESTDGLFVFIGAVPRTQWLGDFVARDAGGFILTGAHARASGAWPLERDPYFLETTQPGVFAVGDARKDSIKRVAAGVGEGSSAIALAHQFLQSEAHA